MRDEKRNHVLALDFGGTKLTAGIVDLHAGQLIVQRRGPTFSGSAQQNLDYMIEIATELLADVDMHTMLGIGISFGGPIEPDRRHIARSMHVPGWEGVALPALITEAFQ